MTFTTIFANTAEFFSMEAGPVGFVKWGGMEQPLVGFSQVISSVQDNAEQKMYRTFYRSFIQVTANPHSEFVLHILPIKD